jgi:TonB family protein
VAADGESFAIQPADLIEPHPITALSPAAPAPASLTFDLDADGRPFNIRSNAPPAARYLARELMPALRATRFAAGTEGTANCRITYTASAEPFDAMDLATLARYGAVPRQQLTQAAWQRIAPGNCRDNPRLAPLLRAYPDWRRIAARPGMRSWSYVRYDVDAAGTPVKIETAISAGDPALDAEVRAAMAQSRFAGGPRTGCGVVLWRDPGSIPAPPIPPAGTHDENPACEIDDRWARAPQLTYPDTYRQRAIEGWAIVRFDVAPWGQIGEITVLEAQPTTEFGDAAVNVLRNARFKPMANGLSGCVDRVIFRMRPDPAAPPEEEAAGTEG